MQRTTYFPNGPWRSLRGELLRWLRTLAWLTASAAATLTALAQAPADTRAAEPPASTAEPAAEPNAASDSVSESAPAWNRRRAAPAGVDGQLRRLAADLGLDAGQQNKIRPVLVAHREQVQRLLRDTRLAPAERQKRMFALGDRSADQIRAQLTDAQRTQYIQPRVAAPLTQAASPARRGAAAASAPSAKAEKGLKP